MKQWILLVSSLYLLTVLPVAQADRERVWGARFSSQPLSASAHLDFEINIGKFLFFRLGAGSYPTASATVNTLEFEIQPVLSIAEGNNQVLSWDGTVPGFSVASVSNSLPVEVRSNAGQVSIRATTSGGLSNGSTTLPLSDIVVTSSDPGLPAPLIPVLGNSPSVNVTGTQFSNLVTVRSADWVFNYTGAASVPAGVYNGEITFTASAP